jgi:hypothetical protein
LYYYCIIRKYMLSSTKNQKEENDSSHGIGLIDNIDCILLKQE